MDITYIGHSSFKLKGKNASIITDPFDQKMVGLKFPKNSADIVTISHDHEDHNFAEGVSDVKKVVQGPGEYEIMGVSIIGIPTYHDSEKGEKRGRNTIFVFEIDGLRLAHLGDLGHKISEEMAGDMGDIDILFVPVGGEFTIDAATAVEIVQLIEPSYVIPMHYKKEGLNPQTFAALAPVDDFLKATGMQVEKVNKFSVKKGEIPDEEKKVIVFE